MEAVSEYKCYNCGKLFRDEYNYNRHKNRKTPCLIKDIKPSEKKNPNRCIYCNRIFTTKGNLQRHYNTCKIKNGGMEILADKVMQEQKIKELEEKLAEEREERKILEDKVNDLAKIIKSTKVVNNGVNNGIINNNNIGQQNNFTICPFDKPVIRDTDLQLTVDQITHNDLTKLMFRSIYFNPKIPENHCLYLLNKKEHQLLYHDRDDWRVVCGAENVDEIVIKLANTVAARGGDYLNGSGGPYGGRDADYLALPGAVQTSIREFNEYKNLLDRNSAYEVFIACKDIVRDTIKGSGCRLLK